MQMLLFYGLNTTSGTSFPIKAASSGVDGTPTAKHQGTAGMHSEVSTPGLAGYTGPAGGQGHGTDAIKQRKLEERMGPGGTGHQSGVRRAQPQRGQNKPHLTPATADPYEDPALHFSGHQQFFFRFIVHTDNYRFLRCLEESIAAEIKDLTHEQSTQRRSGGATFSDTSIASNGAASSPTGRGRSGSQLTDEEEMFCSGSSSSYSKSSLRDGAVDSFESFDTPQYSSSTQSFALRTVKLRILGKFLGLLTFWPQWSLLVSTGDRGPLSLLARDAARIRGALRPATSYPLRSILEKAWVACRLSYTVPWVVEFLKMMVWDCTYTLMQNPYRDVFGCLRSIQRSDLLHPIRGRPTSNRLYVLTEIQNLWSVVSLSDLRRTILPPTRSKPGKLDYGSDRSLDIDDQSRAFSLSFLHHVSPPLNEALNVIKKRLQLNLAKRSPMPQPVLRSAHTAPSTRSALSSTTTVAVSTAEIVFSTKKRQTPNLVAPPSSPFPVGGLSAFSPSVNAFSSPSSSTSKKTVTASTALQEMTAQDPHSAPFASTKGGIPTSLMAQFSAVAVEHTKPYQIKAWSGPGSESGGLSSQRVGSSPLPLPHRGTSRVTGSVGIGTDPESASKTPRSKGTSTGAADTTTATATPTAGRSTQYATSPFRGGDPAAIEDVTLTVMSSDSTALVDRCSLTALLLAIIPFLSNVLYIPYL